jgi:hypothetical protein
MILSITGKRGTRPLVFVGAIFLTLSRSGTEALMCLEANSIHWFGLSNRSAKATVLERWITFCYNL